MVRRCDGAAPGLLPAITSPLNHALRLFYDPSQADLVRRVALVNKRRRPAPRKATVTTGP